MACNWLRVDHRVPGDTNYCARNSLVDVCNLCHVHIRDVRIAVVVVRNGRDVCDSGVAGIHISEICPAYPVRRNVRFAVSKREPAHRFARRDRHAKVASTNPSNQSRCVHRPHCNRSRHPTPRSSVVHPASVVSRRKSPRSIVNPGPAPRINPHPMTIVIRRPARSDGGLPHRTVGRRNAPRPIVVEILRADHIRRNITRRLRILDPLVPHTAPIIEAVAIGLVEHLMF